MLLFVTPNPAVDRSCIVPHLSLGAVNRAQSSMVAAGGKGLNAARAARTLGGSPKCAGFVGGRNGRWLTDLAQAEGFASHWTWIASETRICTILADPEAGTATVVNEPGPSVTAADWSALHSDVLTAAADCDLIGLSGSVPPGSPPEAYPDLVRALVAAGKSVWVDSSGLSLRAAIDIPGIGLKVNGEEASAILGQEVNSVDEALRAADGLVTRGLAAVVLTLGASGAVISHPQGRGWARPPQLRVLSAVGSGDSFFAGLLLAFARQNAVSEALSRAVAAGAANALSLGGGSFTPAEFERIYAQTVFTAR